MSGGGIGGVLNNPSMQNMQNLQNSLGQQPGLVQAGQGGFGQGTPFQRPLPEGYQSPYANYGFDSGFQSYLDNQYLGSMSDAGVNYQYDPINQTFTGGTMAGRYNPIPLNVMQQAAGGNRDVLSPYFQSKYPQPTGPAPTVKPGMPQMPRQPMPGQGPQRPFNPRPFPGQGNDIRRGPMSPQIQQPVDPRRSGLGALPGLNGVPGNQNPLYFGPGYK